MTKPSWDDHKHKPVNKETADHSFYYCTAVGLVAGDCTSEQFTDRWLKDADVARLMALSTLEAKPELTTLFGFEPEARTQIEIYNTAKGLSGQHALSTTPPDDGAHDSVAVDIVRLGVSRSGSVKGVTFRTH